MNQKSVFITLCSFLIMDFAFTENVNPANQRHYNGNKNIENSDSFQTKSISLRTDDVNSENKNLRKRRVFLGENNLEDVNFWNNPEKFSEAEEYNSRRRNNYSNNESEAKITEKKQKEYNDRIWENEKNIHPHSFNKNKYLGNELSGSDQIFKGHENSNLEFEQEKTKSFFEENQAHIHENGNSQLHLNTFAVDKRIKNFDREALISLSDRQKIKTQNHDFHNNNIMQSNYPIYSGANYNRAKESDYYPPPKGLVINLKTECPVIGQNENQMVHKFIFTPKSQANIPFIGGNAICSTSSHISSPFFYF